MRILQVSVLLLFLVLCTTTFNKYKRLARPKSNTELDSLEIILANVKKKISPNSSIGFSTNTTEGRKGVLYFKTALVLAPIVVELAESDTMLILEEIQFPLLPNDKYEKILSGKSNNLKYSLVHIKR